MSVAARRGGRFVRRLAHRLTGAPETDSAIWETIQLARHQDRPYPLDYIARLCPDFEEGVIQGLAAVLPYSQDRAT